MGGKEMVTSRERSSPLQAIIATSKTIGTMATGAYRFFLR